MAFPIIPKKRSGATGSPTSLTVGELAVNTATGELFLGGDSAVLLLNPPTAAGTTATEATGDGTTTAFTFTGYNGNADGGYLVSVGGIDQPPSKYAVTSTAGGTITFVEAPTAGELISIRALVAGSGGSGDATSLQGRDLSNQVPDDRMSVTWNQALNHWQPSFTTELNGVPIGYTTPTSGQGLVYDGTEWAPAAINATELQETAISATAPESGNFLQFDGSEWKPTPPPAKKWESATIYAIADVVEHNGGIYKCIAPIATVAPSDNSGYSYWALLGGPANTNGPTNAPIYPDAWMRVALAGGPFATNTHGWIPVYF